MSSDTYIGCEFTKSVIVVVTSVFAIKIVLQSIVQSAIVQRRTKIPMLLFMTILGHIASVNDVDVTVLH